MCDYWYYRKETIETYGNSKLLIVCEKGNGFRNFKILARNGNTIDVGFSIGPVNVPAYNIYYKGMTKTIRQAYYVLNVETGKIRRVQLVNANTIFPRAFKKTIISFCSRKNVGYTIFSDEKEYYVKPYDERTGEDSGAYNINWLNIDEIPESVFMLDFETKEVQKVHTVTFLK